jgi:hypothetical protein
LNPNSSFDEAEGDVGPVVPAPEYRNISGTDGGATFLGCGIVFCDRDITVDLFTMFYIEKKKEFNQ